MAVCGTSTGWAKWAFIVMCIALILFIVGFSTLHWMQNEGTTVTSVGLWRLQTCTSGTCATQTVPSSYKNGKYKLYQFLIPYFNALSSNIKMTHINIKCFISTISSIKICQPVIFSD